MKHGTCMPACHGSLVLCAWSFYCVRSEVWSYDNAYREFGRNPHFRDHQLIASRLRSSNNPVTARFKPALKRCVIVAGPRKKGVLMMHGLVKELSVVHLGEGLGSVALANQ